MIYGLNIVNKTVKKLSYLDNTNIIHYDLNSNMLDFFRRDLYYRFQDA